MLWCSLSPVAANWARAQRCSISLGWLEGPTVTGFVVVSAPSEGKKTSSQKGTVSFIEWPPTEQSCDPQNLYFLVAPTVVNVSLASFPVGEVTMETAAPVYPVHTSFDRGLLLAPVVNPDQAQ